MNSRKIKELQEAILRDRLDRDRRHPIMRFLICLWIGVFVPRKYRPVKKNMRHRMRRDFRRNVVDAWSSIKCLKNGHKIGTYKTHKWCQRCHQVFKGGHV